MPLRGERRWSCADREPASHRPVGSSVQVTNDMGLRIPCAGGSWRHCASSAATTRRSSWFVGRREPALGRPRRPKATARGHGAQAFHARMGLSSSSIASLARPHLPDEALGLKLAQDPNRLVLPEAGELRYLGPGEGGARADQRVDALLVGVHGNDGVDGRKRDSDGALPYLERRAPGRSLVGRQHPRHPPPVPNCSMHLSRKKTLASTGLRNSETLPFR